VWDRSAVPSTGRVQRRLWHKLSAVACGGRGEDSEITKSKLPFSAAHYNFKKGRSCEEPLPTRLWCWYRAR
jgi:hypothetical protein